MMGKKILSPNCISGVNLPIINAESDVIVAFHKHRDAVVHDVSQQIDETDGIVKILKKAKRPKFK